MRITIKDLDNWPANRNGQPIFNTTQDAYLYAQLIWDKPQIIEELNGCLKDALANLKFERSQKQPKLNMMMHMVYKTQFYRECLEEIQRIKD